MDGWMVSIYPYYFVEKELNRFCLDFRIYSLTPELSFLARALAVW
jgi:hypothetical protein